jgi:hypothetical protein
MEGRITPDNITSVKDNERFVFGSNKSGHHSKGAAKTAMGMGAIYKQGSGPMGKTYGIPTKSYSVYKTLTIEEIKPFVDEFILYAKEHPELIFYVTLIGCGLAGYKPKNIAPLFKEAIDIKNIHLPIEFWNKLLKDVCE